MLKKDVDSTLVGEATEGLWLFFVQFHTFRRNCRKRRQNSV